MSLGTEAGMLKSQVGKGKSPVWDEHNRLELGQDFEEIWLLSC